MAGKWREFASERSSAQKQRMNRFVWRVTGSVKSPPGGETAPMIEMLPCSPPIVTTRPARS